MVQSLPDPASSAPTAVQPADGTRAALVLAGLRLFGQKGFAATSTREIAGAAGANIGSIAYHFGGKEGLLLACAETLGDRLAVITGPPADPEPRLPPDVAADRLAAMLDRFAGFLIAAPEAADVAAFLLRQMTEDGPALDLVYDRMILPKHRELCALWSAAIGAGPDAAETERVKVAVFAMMGQAAYFRIARPVVTRRLGHAPDAAAVVAVLLSNLRAVIERERQG